MKLPRRRWIPVPAFLFLPERLYSGACVELGRRAPGRCGRGAWRRGGAMQMVSIPGPLRSFMRMAGISQEATPEEMLPLLARNVSLHGYQVGTETEYLVLLRRYVQFAARTCGSWPTRRTRFMSTTASKQPGWLRFSDTSSTRHAARRMRTW